MWKSLFLNNRFFAVLLTAALLFALGFAWPWLIPVAFLVLLLTGVWLCSELLLLYRPANPVQAQREVSRVLSLHDENTIHLHLQQHYPFAVHIRVIDELPVALQERHFSLKAVLKPGVETVLSYHIKPFTRGQYAFGHLHVFVSGFGGLLERRISIPLDETVKVYPSVIQMKKMELYAIKRISQFDGIKKMRRIGHSYEFDQIKQYVPGDDIRSVNWKATGRSASLMVNHYEDEKAQQVYCLIDKSRTMKMPFQRLTLMDYAINAALVISNLAIRKQDKAGLMTFSHQVNTVIPADRHAGQVRKILEALYAEKEKYEESSYEYLYLQIRKTVKVRSLLFLFTHFESAYALQRVLPIWRKINRLHLLVVIFFQNEEIKAYGERKAAHTEDIFLTTTASAMMLDKKVMVQELNNYGIQTIITTPAKLTLNTINKYLELKARGMI